MPIAGMLTVKEAADQLGVDPSSVRHAILAGRLAAAKAGRDWLLRPADVAAYQARRRNAGRRFGARQRAAARSPAEG